MNVESNVETVVDRFWSGKRLDQYAAAMMPAYSREQIKRWIASGEILLDQKVKKPSDKVFLGQRVLFQIQPVHPIDSPQAQNIPLSIIHEDDAILIIDKPAGLTVHPGNGNPDGTLMNALLHHCPASSTLPRAGIVHRLDKDTSGLLVVAKTLVAQTDLVRQLKAKTVTRLYRALVIGHIPAAGTVDAPIGRHPVDRIKMAVVASGKLAVTHYRPISHWQVNGFPLKLTWVECQLETGRTHQIRVHLQSLGYPLVGDPRYGLKRSTGVSVVDAFPRQALHACELALTHPLTGEKMTWASPTAEDIMGLLGQLTPTAP